VRVLSLIRSFRHVREAALYEGWKRREREKHLSVAAGDRDQSSAGGGGAGTL
jgi:hypothetical protein